jgi:hypothetical protein
MQQVPNSVITAQVQSLLDTDAQQISSIKGRPTHPLELVNRGQTRLKTNLSMRTPAEYLYGLNRLMFDDRTPALDKPKLSEHFYHVIN